VAGSLQLCQTRLVAYVEAQEAGGGWLGWSHLDLVLGVAPVILFTYPVISFLRDWCKTPNDHWQPAMYADESGHEDSDTSALLGGEDSSHRSSTRPMGLPGADDDYDAAGAPVQHLHYAEASSYGSQSASSFAALYSKYVTDDVTVAVRRTSTEDSSIHVSSYHGSNHAAHHFYDRSSNRSHSFHGDQ